MYALYNQLPRWNEMLKTAQRKKNVHVLQIPCALICRALFGVVILCIANKYVSIGQIGPQYWTIGAMAR